MRKDFKYPYRVISVKNEQKLNDDFMFALGGVVGYIIYLPFSILGFFLPEKIFNKILDTIKHIIQIIGFTVSLACIIYIIYVFFQIINN